MSADERPLGDPLGAFAAATDDVALTFACRHMLAYLIGYIADDALETREDRAGVIALVAAIRVERDAARDRVLGRPA